MSKTTVGKSDSSVSYTPVAPLNKDDAINKLLAEYWSDRRTVDNGGSHGHAHKKAKRKILALLNNQIQKQVTLGRLDELKQSLRKKTTITTYPKIETFQVVPILQIKDRIKALQSELKDKVE